MKVGFLDTVHPILWDGLVEQGFHCLDFTGTSLSDIEKQLPDINGLVIRSRFTLNQEFLEKCLNLKFIARSGAGLENIDLDFCTSNGIKLFSAAEGNRNAVGEHALGMLLALFNQFNKSAIEIKNGVWDREGNRGEELYGKTVGIIGFGNNGRAFAEKLSGFEVRILAYDKYKKDFGTEQVHEVDLSTIQKECDVISFHIPQNSETVGMFNSSFIASCHKPFYLINIARGKIVKTEDLLGGLNNAKVLGACLDVLEFEKSSFENMFENEQIPQAFKALIAHPKVIITPHVAGWTTRSYQLLSEVLLHKILDVFSAENENIL